ncbi:MAG: hypothetical protein ACK6DF_15995, partial [Betaproteobacteria bacterium]
MRSIHLFKNVHRTQIAPFDPRQPRKQRTNYDGFAAAGNLLGFPETGERPPPDGSIPCPSVLHHCLMLYLP